MGEVELYYARLNGPTSDHLPVSPAFDVVEIGEDYEHFGHGEIIDAKFYETLEEKNREVTTFKKPNDDDETDDSTELDRTSDTNFYATLEEKNRAITMLKKRVMNQEIQLSYFLNKTLSSESVTRFSEKCAPQLAQENISACLAMCKFMRDSGERSPLSKMHDELRECQRRLTQIVEIQEDLLQKVTNETMKEPSNDPEMDTRFADRAVQMAQLDLYSRLTSATLKVGKEIEMLRIDVGHITTIEESRNSLINHVFSLPPEQRTNGLRLAELECRLSMSNQDALCRALHEKNSCFPGNGDYLSEHVKEALRRVESDALSVLAKTEEQRNKFAAELASAREQNVKLAAQLKLVEEMNPDENVIVLQDKCTTIEQEIEDMKRGLDIELAEKDRQIERMEVELRETVARQSEYERREKEKVEREKNLENIINIQEEQIKNLLKILSTLDDSQGKKFEEGSFKTTDATDNTYEGVNTVESEGGTLYAQSTLIESTFGDEHSFEVDGSETNEPKTHDVIFEQDQEKNCDDEDAVNKSTEEVNGPKCSVSCSSRSFDKKLDGNVAMTSLKVEAYNKHGVKESMRATLESTTEVDGILEMNNSSRVRLRLQCTSPRRRTVTSDRCCQTRERQETQTDVGERDRWLAASQRSMQLLERLNNIGDGLNRTLVTPGGRRIVLNNIKELYSQFCSSEDDM